MCPNLVNFEATNLEFVIQIQSKCIEFLPDALKCIFHLVLGYTAILGNRYYHTYFVNKQAKAQKG